MENKPEIFKCDITGDQYKLYHHSSGLDVLIMKMEGFTTTEAIFATKYGSINNCFKTKDTDGYIKVPDGIAHYLEHKLFENEDCSVFEQYAKTGANANAYTSFCETAYTFSCSSDYEQPLRILFDCVQSPYFTDENVEKERGIIAQEIKMSNDSPERALFFTVLESLYHNHPVKIDIAGTEESIKQIDKDLLYKCYNTFYNLNNMVLAIAGNIDDEKVLKICDECLKPSENKALESVFGEEPENAVTDKAVINRQVGIPIFAVGFKCSPLKGREMLKKELSAEILMKMLFGKTSEWYKKAIEEGLITTSMSMEVFNSSDGFFVCMLSNESETPEKVYESIMAEIKKYKEKQFDEKLFKALLKGKYGSEIYKFNIVSECAESMYSSYFQGYNSYDIIEILYELTIDDIKDALSLFIDPKKTALCIVENK